MAVHQDLFVLQYFADSQVHDESVALAPACYMLHLLKRRHVVHFQTKLKIQAAFRGNQMSCHMSKMAFGADIRV